MTSHALTALVLGGVTFTLAVPIAFKVAGRPPAFMTELGYSSGPRGTRWAWSLAVLLAFAYAAFSVAKIPEVARYSVAISWLKALSILAALAAGIVEEAFFRRFLMDAVLKAGGNASIQIGISALAFGVAHGTWGLLGGNLHVAFSAAVATTILGAGLAIIYIVGGRSLAPCILAHFLIDAVIEPGLLLSAMSGNLRA